MNKYTITESGYIFESDTPLTDTDHALLLELELKLADLPSRQSAGGKVPKAITKRHDADDQTVLAFIASLEAPSAQRYIKEQCPLPERQVTAALKRLFKSKELELRPATYINGAGKERSMQGVFFTEPKEPPKTFLPE